MHNQLPILLLLTSLLPSALSTTTLQAFLAPDRAAASVLAVAPDATTYSIQCTQACAANADNNQATLVNGPSTAGFTQIMGDSGRTLILDCKLLGGGKGDCATKAISAGETRTVRETLSFKAQPVVITGGLEKLGYVVVETTMEVNTTVTLRRSSTVASSTGTATLTRPASTSTAGSSSASRTAAGVASTTRAVFSNDGTMASRPNSAVSVKLNSGLAIVGLAGLLLAAL